MNAPITSRRERERERERGTKLGGRKGTKATRTNSVLSLVHQLLFIFSDSLLLVSVLSATIYLTTYGTVVYCTECSAPSSYYSCVEAVRHQKLAMLTRPSLNAVRQVGTRAMKKKRKRKTKITRKFTRRQSVRPLCRLIKIRRGKRTNTQ